jgi:hypothetical protein
MPAVRRLTAAGAAGALTLCVLAGAFALLGSRPIALWLAMSGALLLAVTLAGRRILARPRPESPPGDDDGGIGPSGPDDGEPPWWPDFERDFRAHVRRRTRV